MQNGKCDKIKTDGISEGWKLYRLSDIVEIIGGGTPKTGISEYWGGRIPWLSVVDFGKCSRWVYKTEKTITQKGLEESSTKILRKGQLIISARGTVGEIAQLGCDMAFNQSCYGVNGKKSVVINDFLFYLLKTSVSDLKQNTHGAVFDTITRQTFDCINVAIPSIQEQQSIAKILSDLDEKIELNHHMIKTLESIAQALFKRWFVDFDFPDDRGRPYKSSGGKMVESDFGEIPEGWSYSLAGLVSTIGIGRTPPRKEHEWFSENPTDVRWVSIRDMGNVGVFIEKTAEYLTAEAVKRFNVFLVPDNTPLLSFKLTVGRVALTDGEMVTNEAIAYFLSKHECVTNYYLYLYLKAFDYQSLGSTSSIATAFNSDTVRKMPILLPSKKVANGFLSAVSRMFDLIKLKEKEIVALADIRDSLLPKIMTGEIRVNSGRLS